jgi:sporulation protein YlmC with PRC-barrel domain
MEIIRLSAELKDKPIVSMVNGKFIAKVKDVLIDPTTRTVSAVIFEEGSILSRQTRIIPASAVNVWGVDIILISSAEAVVSKEELPCHEQCLSVSSQLKGRSVVTQDGKQIGELNDVVIDDHGVVVGYDLAKVLIEGPVAKSKRIGVDATHALGPDVLVIDQTRLPQ